MVEDGVSGFVSNDPELLREGVRRLLADPELATQMGQAARAKVLETFSIQNFIDGWERAIAEARARFSASNSAR